jgi:hypothetical protein
MIKRTWRILGFVGWVASSFACVAPNPRSCLDGTCTDPAYRFCDVDGTIAGQPDACIAVSCTPSEFAACRGDEALMCSASGDNYDVVACDYGCSEANLGCNVCTPNTATCGDGVLNVCGADGRPAGTETCQLGCSDAIAPHCEYLQPKYLPSVCDELASEDLTYSSVGGFDTDLDNNCTGGVVIQTGGPAICVVRARTITISESATLNVSGSRALALVADETVLVAGVLDISANSYIDGPAGGFIKSGGVCGMSNGGGGAGFQTAGSHGGNATNDGGAANGGMMAMDPALLAALVGGSRVADSFPAPGGAGGAATLISCRGTVSVTGTIDANGGGGSGGALFFSTPTGGSAGGSGGNVVLQGANVSITGNLFANGGAGGAGKPTNAAGGAAGQDGQRAVAPAARGGLPGMGNGAGGNGGAQALPPTTGKRLFDAGAGAGGGGGSVGFLQTYTPQAVQPTLTPALASPDLRPNGTVSTR